MHDDLDMADLGYRQPTLFEAAAGRNLGEGDGIVPAFALETGITGLFTCLDPPKESFEGQIHPDGHVLQNLGVGQVEISSCLDSGQYLLLNPIVQGSLLNLPGIFALLQQAVVKITGTLQEQLQEKKSASWLDKAGI